MFAYFNAVRKEGVVPDKEKAMQQWRQVSFDYQTEASSEFQLVQGLGGAVNAGYAPEDLLAGSALIDKPDSKLSMEVMESLNPRRMNVFLMDPSFDEKTAKEFEPYYEAKYNKEALKEDLMARLEKAHEK